jgi:tryptophan-rich sensory protein
MGISFFIIVNKTVSEQRNKAIIAFFIQLILNFLWSFIFFQFHQIGMAFIEIILLWFAIIWMLLQFYKVNKLAAYLNIPYLLWVSFASVLNFAIWNINK